MAFANPLVPNLPDFLTFVGTEMQIPPSALPPPLPVPAAPTLTAGTGGSLPAGPIYVVLTYVSGYGETTAGAEASVTVAANGSVALPSPAAQINATGYNVYAGAASGAEVLQNTTPIAIGTGFTLDTLAAGVVAPTINTSGSPWPGYALTQAEELVLNIPGLPGLGYALACYNCAGHILIKITPDVPGQSYFKNLRTATPPNGFGLAAFSVGVVAAASDESTSNTLLVPDFAKGLKISDLDFIRTPYGREYLAYNQDFGPNVFGIS